MKIAKKSLLAISLISVGTVTPIPGFISILDTAATIGIFAGPVLGMVGSLDISKDYITKLQSFFIKNTDVPWTLSNCIFYTSFAAKTVIHYYKHSKTQNEIIKSLKENNSTNQKILEKFTEKKETEQTT